jgi:hypothetical protein
VAGEDAGVVWQAHQLLGEAVVLRFDVAAVVHGASTGVEQGVT